MSALAFTLTPAHEASAPPAERDEVRLLVAQRGRALVHDMFRGLPAHLRAGRPARRQHVRATLPARAAGAASVDLHLSTPVARAEAPARAGSSSCAATAPATAAPPPASASTLPGGGSAELLAPYLSPGRLWIAALDLPEPLHDYLAEHGRPIAYAPPRRRRARSTDLQTVFADEPGSAEMPSAGRPFTQRVLDDLLARGVQVAPLVLHTGVSSLERGERPYPERYRVPALTASARQRPPRGRRPRDRRRHDRRARARDRRRARRRGRARRGLDRA